MDQTTVSTETTTQEAQTDQQPDINQTLGNALWGVPQAQVVPPAATQNTSAADTASTQTPPPASTEPEYETIDLDEYVQSNFGVNANELKERWNKYKEYDTNPPTPAPQEIQWANDESKRLHELIREGKHEEVWRVLDQQRSIQQLETLTISNAQEAEQIIKANLRFKHADLDQKQIDRLFQRQYGMPPQPVQGNMDDDDYAIELNTWKQQVQQREEDMKIDATIVKPDLAKYKSNIVLPDIQQRNEPPTQTVDQEALAQKHEAFRNNYLSAVGSNYQNFKGYTTVAKDGDVELPISYVVSPEEQIASKQQLETFDSNQFLDSRWFDEKGNPKVTQIQEDLYLLQNRDRIFQKIANEASAQRYLHHVKKQNNINLNGVTNTPPPAPTGTDTRTDSQKLGDAMWGKR